MQVGLASARCTFAGLRGVNRTISLRPHGALLGCAFFASAKRRGREARLLLVAGDVSSTLRNTGAARAARLS